MMKNYYKPTPVHFRKIGDAILFFCVGAQPILLTLPLNDHKLIYVTVSLSLVGLIGKTITNLFKEE